MLGPRALNRAALSRQGLLERWPAELGVRSAIRRSVGLNAQTPNSPYLWLWARLAGFRIEQLTSAIEDATVVRSVLMRATQHVVAADDFGWLRAVVQPLLGRVQRNVFGRATVDVDPDELVAATRDLLAGRTLTRPELGRLLDERWPGRQRYALAWSAQYLEPILHPAPSGTWNTLGPTPFVLASDLLGPPHPAPAPQFLVRRYLAAYGPATAGDLRTWCGVSGLPEVVDGLRPELRLFRDERGRELVDLPDAVRPDADVPAPVRFLPEFDNLMLAYADRTRMMTDEVRRQVCVGDGVAATVLVDGAVGGTWAIRREDAAAVLTMTPFAALTRNDRDDVEAEGMRLLAFAAADADIHDVRVAAPGGDTPLR